MIFIFKVQDRHGNECFVNLSHVTSTATLENTTSGAGIRLHLVGGEEIDIFGKSAELMRSHLDGMAMDFTGAPQGRNSALEEC